MLEKQYIKPLKVGDRVKASRRHGPWELRCRTGKITKVQGAIYEATFPATESGAPEMTKWFIRCELVPA